jgi:hypothetical protein
MTEKMVKLRLLADSFNLYHYDEWGMHIKKRGYKRVEKGNTFEVPDYVAERLLQFNLPAPNNNFVRRNAVLADSDEDPYADGGDGKFVTLAPGVSQRPEYDFGSTTVAGDLIADPDGDLTDQRAEARQMELKAVTPDKKRPEGKAVQQSQSQAPAQQSK